MTKTERITILSRMGASISQAADAIERQDTVYAKTCFVEFMAAAGLIAMEIDGLDNTDGN